MENGICSAAFCESAALRASACSPERADFPRPGEVFPQRESQEHCRKLTH